VQFLTKVPIEGVGLVHVVTKPYGCRYDSWETDIVLWRYPGKVEEQQTPGLHAPRMQDRIVRPPRAAIH